MTMCSDIFDEEGLDLIVYIPDNFMEHNLK